MKDFMHCLLQIHNRYESLADAEKGIANQVHDLMEDIRYRKREKK